MTDTFFEIIRPGINTTIQDRGRNHLYHIGITISGAMDQKIFKLSNALVNNDLNQGAIEFAYQGPLLKLKNGNINFSITGDVHFNIIRKNSKVEEGKVFENGSFLLIFHPETISNPSSSLLIILYISAGSSCKSASIVTTFLPLQILKQIE